MRFDRFDIMMASVDNHNKNILGILTLYNKFKMSELNCWVQYVHQTTDYFKNRVFYWEIINQIDLIGQWTSGIYAKDYVRLLKEGYNAIKCNSLNAQVLFSGIANSDRLFLDSVLVENVSDYFDIMNVHRYTDPNTEPEEILDYLKRLDLKLRKYGIEKPVWLTETGGSTMPGLIDEGTLAVRLPRIFLSLLPAV